MSTPPYKIAILVEALGGGGAERSAGMLSQIFHRQGHEVFMVTITDVVEYPFSGHLVNMGKLKGPRNGPMDKFKRFMFLKFFLSRKKVDFILDFRFRKNFYKEWLISKFLFKGIKVVYMVRSFNTDYYFPPPNAKTTKLFSKAFSINTVSERISEKIKSEYDLHNLSQIKNPIDFSDVQRLAKVPLDYKGRFIVAAGRMSIDVKRFDKLIMAYSRSHLPKEGVALKILGIGKLMNDYKIMAEELNIQHLVHFEGFKENPFPYFKGAAYFVLCSKFEGSPRALIESLACGTPVIAMDCPTGPREIIMHGQNGLLVPNDDFEALTQAMNLLMGDQNLRKKLEGHAEKSISCYDIDNVGEEWQNLLNSAT